MIRKNWRNMGMRNRENEYRNSFRRRLEKNILSDDVIEAESQKEFDILAKTMGATEDDLANEEGMSYTVIIGRAKSDPEMKGQKVVLTLSSSSGPGSKTLEQVCSTGGKSKEIILKHVRKGDLVCVEGKPLNRSNGEISINRITFLKAGKTKTEKVHKVASICKPSANEGDGCLYKVSCVTREYAATRKKYSGEFESLQDAMKVCAQAYNAGVDVFVECGDQPFAKIYTRPKNLRISRTITRPAKRSVRLCFGRNLLSARIKMRRTSLLLKRLRLRTWILDLMPQQIRRFKSPIQQIFQTSVRPLRSLRKQKIPAIFVFMRRITR